MTLTSTTCMDHLARKSWREADWDAATLRMVHKSLGPEGEGVKVHKVHIMSHW